MITCWEGGLLGVLDDLLAMSALMRGRMEKVAETGSNFLTAGNNWLNLYLTMPCHVTLLISQVKKLLVMCQLQSRPAKKRLLELLTGNLHNYSIMYKDVDASA